MKEWKKKRISSSLLHSTVNPTSFWLRPAGAQSYVVVLKVGSLRDTTGLVTIIRFLLYMRRPPPPLIFAVKWEQGESASRRPIRWSSSRSFPGAWSTVLQPHTVQAFLDRRNTKKDKRRFKSVLVILRFCFVLFFGQILLSLACSNKSRLNARQEHLTCVFPACLVISSM